MKSRPVLTSAIAQKIRSQLDQRDAQRDDQVLAWAWMSGLIGIGKGPVPDGALCFANGPRSRLEPAISGLARHGYEPGVLIVPGCPEAADPSAAMDAFNEFMVRVRTRMGMQPLSAFYQDAT